MNPCATYDDVNLIIKLYDLRREARMREARTWFSRHCRFGSLDEFEKACPAGSDESTSFWQVVSYWDMVASFLTSGVLHKGLFFQSGREMLVVWMRVKPMLVGIRESCKDPTMLSNLETASSEYAEWWSERSPGTFEAMKGFVSN